MNEDTRAPGSPGTADPPPSAVGRRRLGELASFGIGVGAGVIGLLPWLVTGMRLPQQDLWDAEVVPGSMPIALLPLSQYAVTLLAGLLVAGAAAAGLVARRARNRRRRGALLPVALGVLVVQAVAAVQSVSVVADGIEQSGRADLYLAALIAVLVLSIGIGVLVLLLEARAPAPGATVGFSVGALAFGIWLNGLVAPFGALPPAGAYELLGLTGWVPPILVGAAIAWCGVGSVARIVAGVVALLVLWIGAAAITAVSAAAGSRVLASRPLEMLDYGLGVFALRVSMPELVLPPLVVAVVVGAAGVLALNLRRGARHTGRSAGRSS